VASNAYHQCLFYSPDHPAGFVERDRGEQKWKYEKQGKGKKVLQSS